MWSQLHTQRLVSQFPALGLELGSQIASEQPEAKAEVLSGNPGSAGRVQEKQHRERKPGSITSQVCSICLLHTPHWAGEKASVSPG